MHHWVGFLVLSGLGLGGCMPAMTVAGVVTSPMDRRGQFEEIQKQYTQDIRFGLYDDAIAVVEPELQDRFREELERFRQIRFSDHRIESIDLESGLTRATAVVRYRGYWLSSPFEREVRVVQRWRRQAPTQRWFVTPDFEAILNPPS